MSIPKPQYCQQDWLQMDEVPGGRICSACEKKIIDFTGKTWNEIASLQTANNNSLCGLYTQKQLDHWGRQASSIGMNTKAIAAVSSLLLSISPAVASVPITPKIEVHCPDTLILEQPADSTKLAYTIRGKITDSETGEPLPFINVHNTSKHIGAISDFDGNYELQIPMDSSDTLSDTLEFSSIGYVTKKVVGLPEGKSDLTMNVELASTDVDIIAFYVTPVSRTKRIWYRLTKPFRRKR